jgi:hypothetical protein
MHELTVNLHMHTIYSDGSGSHADLARAALKTGIDVLLVTDHNVLVSGQDRYHKEGGKSCLLLACEEIHDQARVPQKNHLLVFGAGKELASLASDPQNLIDTILLNKGVCFIAHPIDPELRAFGEDDISWVDWQVAGFTGIELWNGFSELKSIVNRKLDGLFYAFLPALIARGPLPATLSLWDELIKKHGRVVAVGGSDAHARKMSMGPLRRTIFPYEYHFSAVNTHLLVDHPLSGELDLDRDRIIDALRYGRGFIGYDLSCPTRGFRFAAQHRDGKLEMGDEMNARGPVNLQVMLPAAADVILIKDGRPWKHTHGQMLTATTDEPGVYRVEAYRQHLGRRRGWIFSNPIYLR